MAPEAGKPASDALKTKVVQDTPTPVVMGAMMRKKELIELVVERSGKKKKDVKPAVEAMLEVLGEALAKNRELNLPGFGRVKVQREKALHNGRVVIAKIKQKTPKENTSSETPELE